MTGNAVHAEKPEDIDHKLAVCRSILHQLGNVVVAFSAGVDSTFLLALAVETLRANRVLAAIGVSPSLPQRELASARDLAARLGVELVETPTGEMDNPQYTANPVERCYFCKHDLFSRLISIAKERGFTAVVSGANDDDAGDYRPGLKAGAELGIRDPLMEARLSKADIRELSRRMGLPTWNKPAAACLASRLPYGETITREKLNRIEQAERLLHDQGFDALRVRDHGGLARIEVEAIRIEDLAREEVRVAITRELKGLGFAYVSLDLEGYRIGSMNEPLGLGEADRP